MNKGYVLPPLDCKYQQAMVTYFGKWCRIASIHGMASFRGNQGKNNLKGSKIWGKPKVGEDMSMSEVWTMYKLLDVKIEKF